MSDEESLQAKPAILSVNILNVPTYFDTAELLRVGDGLPDVPPLFAISIIK